MPLQSKMVKKVFLGKPTKIGQKGKYIGQESKQVNYIKTISKIKLCALGPRCCVIFYRRKKYQQ